MVSILLAGIGTSLLTLNQIPKPTDSEGLGIIWPSRTGDMDELKALCEGIKSKM